MRTILAIVVAGAALVSTAALASEKPAASSGRWCVKIYGDGEKDCSFTSLAECNATASGLSAECYAAEPQTVGEGANAVPADDASKRAERANEPR